MVEGAGRVPLRFKPGGTSQPPVNAIVLREGAAALCKALCEVQRPSADAWFGHGPTNLPGSSKTAPCRWMHVQLNISMNLGSCAALL